MRFSVIIPCYNAAATIERALDSLLLGTNRDWEVICIDDCSKDNTADVIEAYANQHQDATIRLLRNKKNSGPGVSRNNGIAIAKGEFLCFLDADDYYDLLTFTILNDTIKETGADVVLYGHNQIIGSTVLKHPVIHRNSVKEYLALAGESLCGGCWRRSLWNNIEIPAISNAEDIAVIPVLISRTERIITIDDLLYNYIHSNSSTSSRHHPQVSHNFVASFHYTMQHMDLKRFHDEVAFHGIKTIIYGATLNALKAGMSNSEIYELWSEFEQFFPLWWNNKYLKDYEKTKRLFIKVASHHWFLVLRCYAHLHNVLLKIMD